MPVIVYSKITGKYLKKHSGSYSDFIWRCSKNVNKPDKKVHEVAYSACPENARIYESRSSALISVGRRNTRLAPEARKKRRKIMVLPDHLEIREIEEIKVKVKSKS